MEECRADTAALYFGFNKDIHQIFDVNESSYKDFIYCMWLLHIRTAVIGLEYFNETNKSWGEAHTQGAWVFLSFVLENQIKGQEILAFTLEEEKKTFTININKEMILCYGHDLCEKLLINLNIWRCTGDSEVAKEFMNKHSEVDEFYIKIKKIVCDNLQPRTLDVYYNLFLNKEDTSVSLVEYPETMEGIIQSFVKRFQTSLNKDIYEQWTKYDTNFIQ